MNYTLNFSGASVFYVNHKTSPDSLFPKLFEILYFSACPLQVFLNLIDFLGNGKCGESLKNQILIMQKNYKKNIWRRQKRDNE